MMRDCQQKLRAVPSTIGLGTVCVLILAVPAIFQSRAFEPAVMAATTPSFTADVAPIFEENCLACHSSSVHKSGLILESYSSLMKGGKHGPPVLPHDAKGSLMVQMLAGDVDPQMTDKARPLSASTLERIKAWINAGADEPTVTEAAAPLKAPSIPEIQAAVAVVSP